MKRGLPFTGFDVHDVLNYIHAPCDGDRGLTRCVGSAGF